MLQRFGEVVTIMCCCMGMCCCMPLVCRTQTNRILPDPLPHNDR